ncbi:MAG: ribosomal RNA small subunit methyltransferase A, partial [Chloroflexi bacterium]|nr:ribosomal RNA small subunit methyltransferase A [Chloroflexota bacterium]
MRSSRRPHRRRSTRSSAPPPPAGAPTPSSSCASRGANRASTRRPTTPARGIQACSSSFPRPGRRTASAPATPGRASSTRSRTRTWPPTCSPAVRTHFGLVAEQLNQPERGAAPPRRVHSTRSEAPLAAPVDSALTDRGALAALLARHGVRAAKGRGQHFLVDRGALAAIVDAAELTADDHVLEVGPGPGVLTSALADRAGSVTAVEVDARMLPVLRETLAGRDNVRIVEGDALAIDLFAAGPHPPTRIVANLPYQITSPLLMRFLGDVRRPPLVVVLVQLEVARRIAAEPGGGERGFLSVFAQSFAEARVVRRVPAASFRPAPRVDSAVVALRTRPAPAFAPLGQEAFLRFVSDAFRHRRKSLASALGYEA